MINLIRMIKTKRIVFAAGVLMLVSGCASMGSGTVAEKRDAILTCLLYTSDAADE